MREMEKTEMILSVIDKLETAKFSGKLSITFFNGEITEKTELITHKKLEDLAK